MVQWYSGTVVHDVPLYVPLPHTAICLKVQPRAVLHARARVTIYARVRFSKHVRLFSPDGTPTSVPGRRSQEKDVTIPETL